VFELISTYNLFDAVNDKVVLLMEFNEEEAVKLLVNNIERIPVCVRIIMSTKSGGSKQLTLFFSAR
jgi:hypothetical protein